MRVLYCNPSFWEYRLPFYVELNRLFKGDFHVLYSTKRYKGPHETMLEKIKQELGYNAHPYDNEWFYDTVSRTFDKKSEEYHPVAISFGLLRRIFKVRPQVLITEGYLQWTPWIILYSLLFRVPVFMGYERTSHTERNAGKLKTIQRKITDWFIKGYLVNGSETKKYLLSIGVKDKKIHVGGMSADSEGLRKGIADFQKVSENNEFQNRYKKEGGLMYLFCGALIERKGVEPLLKAWKEHTKQYPKDSLVMVGGGPLYDTIIEKYGDVPSKFIEGHQDYSEVCRYYAIADVFIMPTIEDNWSLVIPEAMACGLPVATSIYNGCHSELIVEGKNGFVFDTYNQDSIISALAKFHYCDLKAMGKASIELEKPFKTEECARRTYEAIIK